MKHLKLFEEFLSEGRRISFNGKTVKDLVNLDADSALFFAHGEFWSLLDPEEQFRNKNSNSIYLVNKDGDEQEILISDIEFFER